MEGICRLHYNRSGRLLRAKRRDKPHNSRFPKIAGLGLRVDQIPGQIEHSNHGIM